MTGPHAIIWEEDQARFRATVAAGEVVGLEYQPLTGAGDYWWDVMGSGLVDSLSELNALRARALAEDQQQGAGR